MRFSRNSIVIGLLAASLPARAMVVNEYVCTATSAIELNYDGIAWIESSAEAGQLYRIEFDDYYGYRVQAANGRYITSCDYHFMEDAYCEDYQGEEAFLFDKVRRAFTRIDAAGFMTNSAGIAAVVETGFCVEVELDDEQQ